MDENKLTLVLIIMRDADDDFVSLDYEDDNEVKDKDEQKHKANYKDKVKVNDNGMVRIMIKTLKLTLCL